MCIPTKLQQNIISFTKDGERIARFLTETMQGETPGVKVNHRLEAAKHLIKYGFPNADCHNNPSLPQDEDTKAPSPIKGEGWDGGEVSVRNEPVELPTSSPSVSAPVTHLDIINYQVAHLIRHETAEGHTLVEFLVHIMTGRDRPFTPRKFRIKPADRMAAARELLRRGFGDLGSRRKPSEITDESNDYDTLHTDLARRMREYSERGTDTVRFLLEVMSDPDPDLEFTIHHRMSAAQELLRRGWDTNYDNIKPKHLQDYWRDKDSTRLSIGHKKTQAGLSTTIDDYDNYDDTDYEAIARQLREDEDREAAVAQKSLPLRRGKVGACPELAEGMGVTEPVSSGMPRSESGGTATSKLPLPQGEGWGEGNQKSHSSPTSKSDNTPIVQNLSMSPAEGCESEEPLSPEEAGQMPAPRGMSDPLMQIAEAMAVHGEAVINLPPGIKLPKPDIRSP